jgi:hypothetical protein
LNSIDFDNDAAVGTHEGCASLQTPTKVAEDFPYDELDSLKDLVRQRIADGETFESIIHSLALEEAEALVVDRLAVFVAIVRSAKKPILFLDCLWMLSGAALREGDTILSLAKKNGCTKQAFQQAMERVASKFPFPKTRTERDGDAKEAMAGAYFKPNIIP